MGDSKDIYAETVRLLRDVSRNHAAAAADMCSRAIRELGERPADPPAPPTEPPSLEVEDLGAMLRDLEDVGLSAICRLARVSDDREAFNAIDEAGAGWLRGVILNRAVETVGPGASTL